MRFSSKQIVTMVVAVSAAVVLMPVAVSAATGSFINIVDPVNGGSKARVNPTGTLWTTEVDPITKAQAKVNADGSRPVTTRPAMPVTPLDAINDLTLHAGDTRRPVFAGLGFRKVTLTSVIASAEGSTAGSVELLVVAYVKSNSTTGDCETLSGFGAAERFTIMVPVGQTVNLTWPTGLFWTQYADANDYYCINVESFGGPTGYTAHFSAYGYRN